MYRYLVVPGSTWYKYRTRKLETLTSGTLMSVSLGTWYQVHRVDRLLKEKGIPGMIHASPNIARIRLEIAGILKITIFVDMVGLKMCVTAYKTLKARLV